MSDTRDRILERRAALIAASLALSGCGTNQPAPVAPVAAPAASASSAKPVEPVAADDELPADLPADLAERWRSMEAEVRAIRAALDRVEKGLQSCATSSDACAAAREDAASGLHEASGRASRLRYICKPDRAAELSLAKRSNREAAQLHERIGKLDERWKTTVGETTWNAAMERAALAKPVPCLSIYCKEWM